MFRTTRTVRLATLFTVAALSLPTLSGCALLAGASVGYIISQEVLPNSIHEAQVTDDVDHVWTAARETFEIMLDPKAEMMVFETKRRIEGEINGADVVLTVEAHDYERTIIQIEATKYLSNDSSTAQEVMDRLLRWLTR